MEKNDIINKSLELLKKDGEIPKEDYKSICEDIQCVGPCSACGAC